MRTNRATACLAVLVWGMAAGAARADEPLLLRHKFEKDQTLIYRTELSTSQAQTFAGQKLESEFKQADVTQRTTQTVDDDGNFHIKSENKRLNVKIKGAGIGDYTFDSTSTEREKGSTLSEALNPLYERLSGAELTVTVSPQGNVIEVEGLEMLLADVLKDNPIGQQFAAGGSKQAARLSYQDSFEQFGKDPVSPGDRWEVPYDIEIPKLGKAQGKRIYTYEGPDKVGDRPTTRIGVAFELAFDVNIEANGAKVTGRLSTANATGTLQFDPAKKSKYTISGNLSIDVNGNNIALQSEQTQTISVELLDKLPE